MTVGLIARATPQANIFGSVVDAAGVIKDHIIQWIDDHSELSPLAPLQDLLLRSQRDDHSLTRKDVVISLLGLLQTNNYFMKHWLSLPKEVQEFGEALLQGRDPPDLNQPLPRTVEFHEAQRVLAHRFSMQSKIIQEDDPVIPEGDGTPMQFVTNLPFSNWGGNVKNTPRYTFVARTVVGIQNLVKWAKGKNYKLYVLSPCC